MALFGNLFAAASLTPHGFCLSWDPDLMALHVASDTLIALSYYSIPICLAVFLARRRDFAFRWAFWLFIAFIFACGTTHVMSIWTLWYPDYATEGFIKLLTASVSVLTAVQLWPLIPKAVALPSPEALGLANARLLAQIRERDAAEQALRREIAERQRAEAMLFEAQKLDAIGKLTGGVAHDFNNLLTAVITNLELLNARIGGDSELRRFSGRALQAATRGGALTQQLLAFARRQYLQPVAFDPHRLVADMADLFRGTLGHEIAFAVTVELGLWQAEADPNQLASALLNLVINARDATPPGGSVTIALRNGNAVPPPAEDGEDDPPAGDYVVISVADTGSGMSASVLKSAFEPFFTTKAVGDGSGLGLSQVYGFVRQSRGHVTLESEPGRGTTVTLYLRRATTWEGAPPVTSETSAKGASPAS